MFSVYFVLLAEMPSLHNRVLLGPPVQLLLDSLMGISVPLAVQEISAVFPNVTGLVTKSIFTENYI